MSTEQRLQREEELLSSADNQAFIVNYHRDGGLFRITFLSIHGGNKSSCRWLSIQATKFLFHWRRATTSILSTMSGRRTK